MTTMTNGSSSSSGAGKIVVVSAVPEESLVCDEATGQPILTAAQQQSDDMDPFNHPRLRRALILTALKNRYKDTDMIQLLCPKDGVVNLDMYKVVHSEGLVTFLSQAWKRWDHLGEEGQDIMCIMETLTITPDAVLSETVTTTNNVKPKSPPLVPGVLPLARDPHQRPSAHVMGQVGYYCTDTCTPIFGDLLQEILNDGAVVKRAVHVVMLSAATVAANITYPGVHLAVPPAVTVYAIPTHPGHHAAADCFGGYCYVNHAALAARLFQEHQEDQGSIQIQKVAILDIDYHAGNGTASIFQEDPTVLVVSIHCHPDHDYPFHSGFADQTGIGAGLGTTAHLPLAPRATWTGTYKPALVTAMQRIQDFGAQALVVSMGLDTYDKDPCAIQRAGFCLQGNDYLEMGCVMGAAVPTLPTVFLQEGGYRMDKIGEAAANVVEGFRSQRK
jgi:acetoin utilization deacetylase AcuC-like enzyme